MADELEVDYASVQAHALRLARLNAGALADVPTGTDVYGFPVLAHAVQAVVGALQQRLTELQEQITADRDDLAASVRAAPRASRRRPRAPATVADHPKAGPDSTREAGR